MPSPSGNLLVSDARLPSTLDWNGDIFTRIYRWSKCGWHEQKELPDHLIKPDSKVRQYTISLPGSEIVLSGTCNANEVIRRHRDLEMLSAEAESHDQYVDLDDLKYNITISKTVTPPDDQCSIKNSVGDSLCRRTGDHMITADDPVMYTASIDGSTVNAHTDCLIRLLPPLTSSKELSGSGQGGSETPWDETAQREGWTRGFRARVRGPEAQK